MKQLFFILVFILNSVIAWSQINPVLILGKDNTDFYNDFFITPDSGFIFGGTFNGGNIEISRFSINGDSLWSQLPASTLGVSYSDFAVLKDGRLAVCGTSTNEGTVLIMDSAANPSDTFFFPSSGWSFHGIGIFSQADSGFVFTGYDDGYTCDNSIVTFHYDKNLNYQWSHYDGICDARMYTSDGFGDYGKMYRLFREEFYPGPPFSYLAAGWLDPSGGVHDSSYSIDPNLFLIQNTSDSGAIACGNIDTLGSKEILLMKIDKNGAIQWSKIFGTVYDDIPESIIQTPDNGYAIYCTQAVPNNAGDRNLRLFKTDVSGNLLWSKEYGSLGDDYPIDMKLTPGGGFALLAFTNTFAPKENMLILTDDVGKIQSQYEIQSGSHFYCEGQVASLTVNPAAVSYLWNTGETSQSISVNTSGDYQVTVTDSLGLQYIVPFFDVRFNNTPDTVLNQDTLVQICDGGDTILSISYDAGSTYQWYADSVLISGENFNIISIDSAANYYCRITNTCGVFTTKPSRVVVNPVPPTPVVTADPSLHACNSRPLILSVDSPGSNIVNWKVYNQIYTGDSLILNTVNRYGITVTQTNIFNCSSSATNISATIDSFPSANIIPDSAKICLPPSNIAIHTSSNLIYGSIYFLFNNMVYDSLNGYFSYPVSFYADTAGTYSMEVENACGSSIDSVYVEKFLRPHIVFYPPSPVICATESFILTCTTPGEYLWNLNSATTNAITINSPGWYGLTLTDSISGCIDNNDIDVLSGHNSVSKVNLGNDTILCPGQSDVLIVQGNYTNALWSTGATGFSIGVTNPGIQDSVYYFVTAIDTGQCATSDTMLVVFDLCNDVNSLNSFADFSYYPNPASDFVSFNFPDNIKREIYFYNSFGQVVVKTISDGSGKIIDTGDLPDGVYTFVVLKDKIPLTGKLVLMRR